MSYTNNTLTRHRKIIDKKRQTFFRLSFLYKERVLTLTPRKNYSNKLLHIYWNNFRIHSAKVGRELAEIENKNTRNYE